ncbi:uncharacterized protein TA12335 [Theileria annulata]|uniref:Endonuclease/exonuclease/phosphatase domain-containing protein n=1 Tax=Theileria annulata TaxID=5874 RepID=Q4UDY8_THEAN|nr:uncharacterized protein TA12335 [Theileria annulata]CAI74701.1 hypothetical protein, conserved [Theileria annulata]|eukprot:XP_952433.1 hypothetical protein, conserved [Theileria annulata]
MNVFLLICVIPLIYDRFIRFFSTNILIYFMYSRCSLYGYRNRFASYNFKDYNLKRCPSQVNLSFLSTIKSIISPKSDHKITTTTSVCGKPGYNKILESIIWPIFNNKWISSFRTLDASLDSQEYKINNTSQMQGNNYAIARVPEEGEKLYLTLFWKDRKLKMERDKSETIGVTLARMKRNLSKSGNGKNTTQVEELGEYSVSFLTNLFKTFDESSNCKETILKSSFISINDNLLKLFTNVPQLDKVKLLHTCMVDCPVPLTIKDEEENNYSHVYVEWLDSEGNLLSNDLQYVPRLSDLGKTIKARVTNSLMKYDIFESNLSRVDLSPNCPWQFERISKFNSHPKNQVSNPLQDQNYDTRVVSFNILSPTYLTSSDPSSTFFPYCPGEYLDYNYRNQLIGREINYLDPDILCLQECSRKVYNDYLKFLFDTKYHSWLTVKGGNAGEGCAIFAKRSQFTPLELHDMYFKDIVKSDEYKPITDKLCTKWLLYSENYFDKYHTVFQFGCYRNKRNNKYLFVANTHLYFHPMAGHIRLLQTYVMLNELEKFKIKAADKHGFDVNSDSYTLMCGDFNSFPNESIYNLIVTGHVSYNHPDWSLGERFVYDKSFLVSDGFERFTEPLEVYENNLNKDEILQVPNFQGYSDSYDQNQLPFTNYCQVFNGTLDFIFHSNNVKVKRNMPGIKAEEASEYIGLPSKLYPSDHLSIAADF